MRSDLRSDLRPTDLLVNGQTKVRLTSNQGPTLADLGQTFLRTYATPDTVQVVLIVDVSLLEKFLSESI
jgi:hypothetical protein